MKSLRGQLAFFWILLAAVCVSIALVMGVLYRSSAGAQIAEATGTLQRACTAISARYGKSLPASPTERAQVDLLQVVLQLVLIETPHVEGGAWHAQGGFLAYAYPTYEGSSVKRDVPAAEQPLIAEVAQLAAQSGKPQTDVLRGSREALIVSACPLASPTPELAAWTMTRTQGGALAAQTSLRAGLGALLAFALVSGAWLGLILWRGLQHVRRLEGTLAEAKADGDRVPELPRTGVLELDRIVAGFNRYRQRFEEAREQLQASRQREVRDQRLAALGRMTGSIAHEIRNPIAAMRLKAENALALGDAPRQQQALGAIVGQIDRLEGLVQSLLALVQPLHLKPRPVDLADWLAERVAGTQAAAQARGVHLHAQVEPGTPPQAVFDPVQLARGIDNLLENAVRHTPGGGHVQLSAARAASGLLRLGVEDDGEGVPEALRAQLFEPFATGRADGTGLGLALAREVAIAHGGDLRFEALARGSRFEMELPWRAS